MVAMLVKVTTGVFWLLPILGYRIDRRGWSMHRRDVALAAIAGLPLLAIAVWTTYADAVKASHAETSWLTSAMLVEWNFGTLGQRLSLPNWWSILGSVVRLVSGPFIAAAVAGVAVGMRSHLRRYWTSVLLACVLPIVVFFNLYLQHDYYLATIAPGIALLIGAGAVHLWESAPRARTRLAALALLSWGITLFGGWYLWTPMYEALSDPEGMAPQAAELAALSRPDDLVLVIGRDWDPAVLYYARRRGLTLPDRYVERAIDEGWLDAGYVVASSARPETDRLDVLRQWVAIAPIGPRTYAIAGSPQAFVGRYVVGARDADAMPGGLIPLVADPVSIGCGAASPFRIPGSARGEWLRFAPATSGGARIRIGAELAPLPLVAAVYVPPSSDTLELTCSGAASVTLLGISAVP